ncbi:MAG: hypothetical protein ACE5E7_17595 [Anaerolineae bacterium]
MHINFYDDPLETPKPREDVRIKRLGLFVYEDRRRVAVGFELTPFLERPSIEVLVTNENGEPAGAMTIIETLDTNFTLTLHLRDKEPTDTYHVQATVYYATPETERMDVHTYAARFPLTPGDQSQQAG